MRRREKRMRECFRCGKKNSVLKGNWRAVASPQGVSVEWVCFGCNQELDKKGEHYQEAL